jgi:NDP-sugar pyrophosphorylase family protein
MNGMLLAAGRGERMEPLSSLVPKPALEVLGRPLLASALEQLRRAGCERVVVNLHRHPEQVARAARASRPSSPLFSWEPELLGGQGGVAAARPLLGPGPVLVANSDTWTQLDLAPLVAATDENTVVLGLADHPDPRRWSSVVLERDGRVSRFIPPGESHSGGGFVFTGFQILGAKVLESLPPPPGEMAALWDELRGQRRLCGVRLHGRWREAGDPEAYRRLVVELLAGVPWVHPGADVAARAVIENSAVGAGCGIEGGARVIDCVLTAGATVGRGCVLRRCVVAGPVRVARNASHEDALILPQRSVPLS